MNPKIDILKRVNIVFILLFLSALCIFLKLTYIKVFDNEKWTNDAEKKHRRLGYVTGERGNILSDDGRLLSTTVSQFDVHIDLVTAAKNYPKFDESIKELSNKMSEYFKDKAGLEYYNMFKEAKANNNQFLTLKKNLSYADMKALRKFPLFDRGRYGGGVRTTQTAVRKFPFGTLGKRTLGYTNEDNDKFIGIEGAYDNYLKADSIPVPQKRTASGEWIPMVEIESDVADGKDITTTIDVELQQIGHQALLSALRKNKARYGSLIIMEVETGEIKAISNLTQVGKDKNNYQEVYNYAIGKRTIPGSTFKIASMMALIQSKKASLNSKVSRNNGEQKFYDRIMRDAISGDVEDILTLERAVEVSSNVGIARIANQAFEKDKSEFYDILKGFGLTQKTGIKLIGEQEPVLKDPREEKWSGVTLPWLSIGYEFELTPLQMLNFYNTIANDGKMMRPYLVKEVREENKVVKSFFPEEMKQICSKNLARIAKKVLNGVVEDGSVKDLFADTKIPCAGKTGTAEIKKTTTGKIYSASFAGFFPAQKPKYSCIVVIHEPKAGEYYGSKVAAPVFKEVVNTYYNRSMDLREPIKPRPNKKIIANEILNEKQKGYKDDFVTIFETLDVDYQLDKKEKTDWVVKKTDSTDYVLATTNFNTENIMPNVEGMSLKDAFYLLENMGLKVSFTGMGRVKSQSISGGTKFRKGTKVNLQLSI